jgi:manganese oxidase
MNAMGHDVKTFIGVQKRDLARQVRKLVPDYTPMGSDGMAMMPEMKMPMPENTLPMMTGFGQFGPIERAGMFTLMQISEGRAPDDYKDPGNYQHPQGTVAHEFKGAAVEAPRGDASAARTPLS